MSGTPTSAVGTASDKGLVAALERAADRLSSIGATAAAGCIAGLTMLVLAEVAVAALSRVIPALPNSIHFGWEYSAYLMGASFLLGSGMTLRAGLQIRVEMLMRAGHGRYAGMFESASSIVGTVVSVYLAWTLAVLTMRTFRFGEVSQDSLTPLWIPQGVLTFGATILALQMIARMFSSFARRPVDKPELGAATAIEG